MSRFSIQRGLLNRLMVVCLLISLLVGSGGLVVVDSGRLVINSSVIIRIDDMTLALLHFDDFFRSHVSTHRDTVVHWIGWRDKRHGWRWRGKGFIMVVDDSFTEVVDATADCRRRFRKKSSFRGSGVGEVNGAARRIGNSSGVVSDGEGASLMAMAVPFVGHKGKW